MNQSCYLLENYLILNDKYENDWILNDQIIWYWFWILLTSLRGYIKTYLTIESDAALGLEFELIGSFLFHLIIY